MAPKPNFATPELVSRKTKLDLETGCWNWIASLQTCGYGQIRIEGRNVTAHRMSWIAHHGPINDGIQVLHACDNPKCCNPAHLYLGNHQDNMRDIVVRKRRRGERHWRRKLRQLDVT